MYYAATLHYVYTITSVSGHNILTDVAMYETPDLNVYRPGIIYMYH